MIGRTLDIRTFFIFLVMLKSAIEPSNGQKTGYLAREEVDLLMVGPKLPPKVKEKPCSTCYFPAAVIDPKVDNSASDIEDIVHGAVGVTAAITSGYFLAKKLGSRTGNPKKRNQKFLVVNPDQETKPKSISPKPKGKGDEAKKAYHQPPATVSLSIGKAPKGRDVTGQKKQQVHSGRMTNAAIRRELKDAKRVEAAKKAEFDAKRKEASADYLEVKKAEKKEGKEEKSNTPKFKAKVTPSDYKNFALENALKLAALQKETKESDSRKIVINYLASMYHLLRTTLNLMEHQAQTLGRDLKHLKQVRNSFVHRIMDMKADEFAASLSGELSKSIPEQFRELKDKDGNLACRSVEVDRIDRAFGMVGPTHDSVTAVACEMKMSLPIVPKLLATSMVGELKGDSDQTPFIHLERFKISDALFLDWLNQKIIPIINLIAGPLLAGESKLETADIVALKQLLAFIGEFYHPWRAIIDPNLRGLLQDCRLLRNKVDHAIFVNKEEWQRSLLAHDGGPKRLEQDASKQEILDLCRRLQSYNPKVADLRDFNGDFNFSLTSHTVSVAVTPEDKTEADDYPNLARFFKLSNPSRPLSHLNSDAAPVLML